MRGRTSIPCPIHSVCNLNLESSRNRGYGVFPCVEPNPCAVAAGFEIRDRTCQMCATTQYRTAYTDRRIPARPAFLRTCACVAMATVERCARACACACAPERWWLFCAACAPAPAILAAVMPRQITMLGDPVQQEGGAEEKAEGTHRRSPFSPRWWSASRSAAGGP